MKNDTQIDISLLFFSFAFFIILFGLFSKLSFQKKSTFLPTPIPQKIQSNTLTKLNYNLPIVCDYRIKSSSISALIENNSIAATIINGKSAQKYTAQGDCLYSWIPGKSIGTKKCGVGNYISAGKQLLSSGITSIETLTNTLQKSGKTPMIDFQAVFKTCKNVKEVKKEVFVVPKGVRFE